MQCKGDFMLGEFVSPLVCQIVTSMNCGQTAVNRPSLLQQQRQPYSQSVQCDLSEMCIFPSSQRQQLSITRWLLLLQFSSFNMFTNFVGNISCSHLPNDHCCNTENRLIIWLHVTHLHLKTGWQRLKCLSPLLPLPFKLSLHQAGICIQQSVWHGTYMHYVCKNSATKSCLS
jgi:hypothetical protein